jgi:glycosyltransferase involved in cell wall biosynthesis
MGVPEAEWLSARRWRREILEHAAAGSDAVVVLSRHAAAVFRQTLGFDPHVIAPGVDLEAFSPGGPRAPTPTIICPAAPEEPRKNVGLLIEAFGLVRQRYPAARLILSRPRAPQVLRGLPLNTPGVRWLDLDDRAALARAYTDSWVGVLPSIGEAFGLVLVEALACGTPVVGYAHAAIPEIIDRQEIGRLFFSLEPGALANALFEALELAGAPQTATECRRRAAEFSTERCTERYLTLYAKLLGRGATWGAGAEQRRHPAPV